jgi:S-adenosylmethionine:tRNA ribosyltransferase-isomerase
MIPATHPTQRPDSARLLVIDAGGEMNHADRGDFVRHLRPGDLVVANDAATIPAGLYGVHEPSGEGIEVRLAGRNSLAFDDIREVVAVVFGEGDHRTPTEHRPLPPTFQPGDRLTLGPLRATVLRTLRHPRLPALAFDGAPEEIWSGIARHGHPIQYAYMEESLALWDVWSKVAAQPVAFEPPSAGFLLDWRLLADLREGGIGFATLTHAAGISSTGDPALDARLPFDEPYRIPESTVRAVEATRAAGGRILALGTTVARALEHAARDGELRSGAGVATQRIGAETRLRVVDALVTGVHEPGESHYELLRAFTDEVTLRRMTASLKREGYRSHEFGDSVLVERRRASESLRATGRLVVNFHGYCVVP